MTDQTNQPAGQDLPPPARFVVGLLQISCGIVLGAIGAVFRVFPVTSILGAPMVKGAAQLSFHGGANITRGIGGIFERKPSSKSEGRRESVAAQNETLPPVE